MVQIEEYMQSLIQKLRQHFGARLLYVGLQGSYLRAEATENSDIDVMVLLDRLSLEDLDAYREILIALGEYERSCGFICSLSDLQNWNRLELCHVLHGTKDYYGILADYLPAYTEEDIRQFAKMSLNNLYHELCHRYLHRGRERSLIRLPDACKEVFFILQNTCYLETGVFSQTKQQLMKQLTGLDREILQLSLALSSGEAKSTEAALAMVVHWCQQKLKGI